jgi:type IX secretion system PorP/SprF family membrane protein
MKHLLSLLFLFTAFYVEAQDPHYSQFFSAPVTLNPAFIGKFDGVIRVTGNHRNQWPSVNRAYITSTAAVDFHILPNKIAYNDAWGIGISGLTEKSAGGAVNFNYASIGTAYHKGLDEEGYHQIGVGFQATYADMSINVTNLKFEDQLTASGFTGVTNEVFNNNSLRANYIDVNAGLMYSGSTADENFFYAGISMYHINRPQQQFTGAYYILNTRTTIHGGGYFAFGVNATLHLSGLLSLQAGATETVLGGAVQMIANPEAYKPTSLYVGSWVRLKDALIPYIGIEKGDLRLGFSYDVNTSNFKLASQNRGGMEISLVYIRPPAESKGIKCPKF